MFGILATLALFAILFFSVWSTLHRPPMNERDWVEAINQWNEELEGMQKEIN